MFLRSLSHVTPAPADGHRDAILLYMTIEPRCVMRAIRTAVFVMLSMAMPLMAQTVCDTMLVSTDWLQTHRLSVKLIEVGDRATYDKGHIPGARLVESSSLVRQLDQTPNELPAVEKLESLFTNAGIGRHGRIIIYSRDPILATRAWFTLDYLGCGDRTSILDGGITKWIAESRPVSTEPVADNPSVFYASIHDQTLTRFPAVREAVRLRDVVAPYLVLLDARSTAQFSGDEPGADVRRPGHIPSAINIPWSLNLTSTATPVFRPVDELRDLYERAGVSSQTRNIVYCRTGMQASVTYFALKYLGFDTTLYDGSFVEWSNSTELVE